MEFEVVSVILKPDCQNFQISRGSSKSSTFPQKYKYKVLSLLSSPSLCLRSKYHSLNLQDSNTLQISPNASILHQTHQTPRSLSAKMQDFSIIAYAMYLLAVAHGMPTPPFASRTTENALVTSGLSLRKDGNNTTLNVVPRQLIYCDLLSKWPIYGGHGPACRTRPTTSTSNAVVQKSSTAVSQPTASAIVSPQLLGQADFNSTIEARSLPGWHCNPGSIWVKEAGGCFQVDDSFCGPCLCEPHMKHWDDYFQECRKDMCVLTNGNYKYPIMTCEEAKEFQEGNTPPDNEMLSAAVTRKCTIDYNPDTGMARVVPDGICLDAEEYEY